MNPQEDTKHKIARAAMAMFANEDFHRVTIRQIAKKAGIPQTNIYRIFEGKEHLLHSIVAEKLKEMNEGMKECLLGVRGALNKLRKMTWFCLRFYEMNPDFAWILYVAIPAKGWTKSEGLGPAIEQGRLLRSIIQEGQESGEIKPDVDRRLAAFLYFGGLQRLAMHWLVGGRPCNLTDAADEFTEILFGDVTASKEQAVPFRISFFEARRDSAPSFDKESARENRPAEHDGRTTRYNHVLYSNESHIAVVTVDGPNGLNAIVDSMGLEMSEAFADAVGDDEARVIIITTKDQGYQEQVC